LTVKQLLRF
jgi:hypothetical protein